MITLTHKMFLLPFLVAFVSCNAPPVPIDDIIIEKTFSPEQCLRAVKTGDYVRYHYNGMFPDGKKFDSRSENLSLFLSHSQNVFLPHSFSQSGHASRTELIWFGTCMYKTVPVTLSNG